MDLVWAQVISDPFLRRLILRYLSVPSETRNIKQQISTSIYKYELYFLEFSVKIKEILYLMCLFPDLYSAELCFCSSVLQKTVNNICRFAYPFFLVLSLQILKLCSLLSSGLQSTSELMTVLTLTTSDYFIRNSTIS